MGAVGDAADFASEEEGEDVETERESARETTESGEERARR